MARAKLTMNVDPPVNNFDVEIGGRENVEKYYAAVQAVFPELFPDKVFTWQEEYDLPDVTIPLFEWPTSSSNRWITQYFGENVELYRNALGIEGGHNGLDLGVVVGTPIFAIAEGVLSKHYDEDGYGHYIRIEHNDNYESIYAHLRERTEQNYENFRVDRCEFVGYSGNTGWSTGPHLHLGIKHNGVWVDPFPLLG